MNVQTDGLETQVARLVDEHAVLDTLYRYAHTIDYAVEDEWLDCFTEDAIWETRRGAFAQGATNHRRQGRAALREQWSHFTHPPEVWNKHILVQPRITFDGDHCTVQSYFFVICAHATGSFIKVFGRYRDRLLRCSDGRWRFEERISEVEGSHPISEPASGPDVSQSLAIEEIKRLKARYCHAIDAKDWTAWGDLFTENATLLVDGDDAGVEGRAAIIRTVSARLGPAETMHEAVLPDIEITGPSSANGTWRSLSIVDANTNGDARTAERSWTRHEEQYTREGRDQWRISSLRMIPVRTERS